MFELSFERFVWKNKQKTIKYLNKNQEKKLECIKYEADTRLKNLLAERKENGTFGKL